MLILSTANRAPLVHQQIRRSVACAPHAIEEQLEVEFVTRPFELDDLIAAVNRAADHLTEWGA